MWAQAVFVFVGGALGAATREFFMLLLPQHGGSFPMDIFSANVLACLLLGFTFSLHRIGGVSNEFTLLLGTGFTGGMSTFSTFVFGAYSEMVEPARLGLSLLYIILSLVFGYIATLLGIHAATRLRRA
ncbi:MULTISPECIES: fluoride efflux transporter CrcB [unclassified Xanthobacter]|uniref:fluoride efflux transporter CrcB n=1 Tax=unclassified Xanthobacter TaxID=2623496 RepID=UPI001EDDCB31|nr:MULTISPECIES: fluoride efflux transporter CrcB [unclassified Xanthobacter]